MLLPSFSPAAVYATQGNNFSNANLSRGAHGDLTGKGKRGLKGGLAWDILAASSSAPLSLSYPCYPLRSTVNVLIYTLAFPGREITRTRNKVTLRILLGSFNLSLRYYVYQVRYFYVLKEIDKHEIKEKRKGHRLKY